MKNKQNKYIFWTPRILSIIFIVFLSLMSLDVFDTGEGLKSIALGLLVHNIPSIILLIILILSWKRELIGAISYLIVGILYTGLVLSALIRNGFEMYYLGWIFQISGIAFLIAILFYFGWKEKYDIIKK